MWLLKAIGLSSISVCGKDPVLLKLFIILFGNNFLITKVTTDGSCFISTSRMNGPFYTLHFIKCPGASVQNSTSVSSELHRKVPSLCVLLCVCHVSVVVCVKWKSYRKSRCDSGSFPPSDCCAVCRLRAGRSKTNSCIWLELGRKILKGKI